jgi:deoxyribodipyrimidine photo-lyase
MNKTKLVIYWARRDFRLTDNPALFYAIQKAKTKQLQFLPIYILDDGILDTNSQVNIGFPRRLYLSKALACFALNFDQLKIFVGNYQDTFEKLQAEFDLEVFVNADVEPYSLSRDEKVKKIVSAFNSYTDQLTVDGDTVSGSGNFYSVFTPFKKAVWKQFIETKASPEVQSIPKSFQLSSDFRTLDYSTENDLQAKIFELIDVPWKFQVNDLEINLDSILERSILEDWYFSESEALKLFDAFLASGKMSNYKKNRDDLGQDTLDEGQTSKMSVALKWGLVSARTLKDKILSHFQTDFQNPLSTSNNEGASHYISELIWREFYRYILLQRPEVLNLEFQPKFQNSIEWLADKFALERFVAWIKGETGYPVVDAAMMQIAKTGWMHNRSRMIVASILTKSLGVDWRWGQEYFRAVLLDLDEASNNGGWQWAASVGADPKPIRIFNPYLQAQNYDSQNLYQKKWLPKNYSASFNPIIEHAKAREEALKRYNLGGVKPRDF